MVAVAVACVPVPGGAIVTVGSAVYPEPALLIVKLVTVVVTPNAETASANDPPPPVNWTVGGEVQPLPGLVTVTEGTWPALLAAGPSVTVPVGKVPTPLPVPKVIVGNDVYPLPTFLAVAER